MIIIRNGLECIIDDCDLPIIQSKSWLVKECNGKKYLRNDISFYVDCTKTKRKTIRTYFHRYIMSPGIGLEVDHINGNTLDNRRENLRICTHKQNIQNQKLRTDNTTGYKGVHYSERRHKYMACIRTNGKTIHMGGYETAEAAAAVYKAKALELFGEYANFGSVSAP